MNQINFMLIRIALVLTDVEYWISDLIQHVVVHMGCPTFFEVERSHDKADATMLVRTNHGTLRRIPIRFHNRWFARKLRGVQATHEALFPITEEALRSGYDVQSFHINREIYEVAYEMSDDSLSGRNLTISLPSLI